MIRDLWDEWREGFRALVPGRFPYARFAAALGLGIIGGWVFVLLKLPLPWMLGPMTFCTLPRSSVHRLLLRRSSARP